MCRSPEWPLPGGRPPGGSSRDLACARHFGADTAWLRPAPARQGPGETRPWRDKALARQAVLVRDCANFGLTRCVRVAGPDEAGPDEAGPDEAGLERLATALDKARDEGPTPRPPCHEDSYGYKRYGGHGYGDHGYGGHGYGDQ